MEGDLLLRLEAGPLEPQRVLQPEGVAQHRVRRASAGRGSASSAAAAPPAAPRSGSGSGSGARSSRDLGVGVARASPSRRSGRRPSPTCRPRIAVAPSSSTARARRRRPGRTRPSRRRRPSSCGGPRIGPTSGLPSGANVNGPFTTFGCRSRCSAGKCSKPTSSSGVIRSRSGGSSSWPKSHGVAFGDHGTRPARRCRAACRRAPGACRSPLEVEDARASPCRSGRTRRSPACPRSGGTVLHREHRQLEPDHPADLAGPQPAGVDDVLGVDGSVLGDDVPGAVARAG